MDRAMNPRWRMAVTFGLLAFLMVHVWLRAKGLFGAPSLRPLILGSFLLLWPTPWLLLSTAERQQIGFGKPQARVWWLTALASGMAAALVCFVIAWLLFGATPDNPFVSVRASFLSGGVPPVGPLGLFLIFTIPGLIFSPFGEEVFCRGVIYGRVRSALGDPSSAAVGIAVSALVFATIHLLHHGVTVTDGTLGFRVGSGAVWFTMMFLTSLVFSTLRRAGGSIWLAIAAHSAFNLAMNAAIFSVLR
jgi:uncharacterized protein